jgi:hypothetical protein
MKEDKQMTIQTPEVDASSYFVDDVVDAAPKHGTTIQAGWGAVTAQSKPKSNGDYPTDFKVAEEPRLVRFLQDEPFAVYKQHWVDRSEGRRSFVCTGAECPLCTIAGDTPRSRVAFNVLVVTDEEPNVQILTAAVTLARQLQAAHEDVRRGPLSKYYWAISRTGIGRETQYALDRSKSADLAEEWDLDSDALDAVAINAVSYDAQAIFVSPHEEMVKVARQLVSI